MIVDYPMKSTDQLYFPYILTLSHLLRAHEFSLDEIRVVFPQVMSHNPVSVHELPNISVSVRHPKLIQTLP